MSTFDFSTFYGGNIISFSSTEIDVQSNAGDIGVVTGHDFSQFGPTGTITGGGITDSLGHVLFGASNLNISLNQVYNDRQDGAALMNDFFGGNDSIKGSTRADVLLGFTGNDKLNGGKGADTLDGGRGNDHLIGGSEGDTFVFQDAGHDYIDGGFDTTGSGHDTISINSTHASSISDLTFGTDSVTGDALVSWTASNGKAAAVTVEGWQAQALHDALVANPADLHFGAPPIAEMLSAPQVHLDHGFLL